MLLWLQEFWSAYSAVLIKVLQVISALVLLLLVRWLGGRAIYAGVNALTQRLENAPRRQAQIKTLSTLLISILNYSLLFLALFTVLGMLGVNVGPVLATAGVAGLAISLGAQQIVRDVLNGFFILVEDQFAVGEYVTIENVSGVVETMGMRITRIRDDQGRLITFANSSITRVINHSRGAQKMSLEVGIAPTLSLQEAHEWLARVCTEFQHPDLKSPLRVQGPTTLEMSRYLFRVVGDVVPAQELLVQDALRAYLIQRAQAEGVVLG